MNFIYESRIIIIIKKKTIRCAIKWLFRETLKRKIKPVFNCSKKFQSLTIVQMVIDSFIYEKFFTANKLDARLTLLYTIPKKKKIKTMQDQSLISKSCILW